MKKSILSLIAVIVVLNGCKKEEPVPTKKEILCAYDWRLKNLFVNGYTDSTTNCLRDDIYSLKADGTGTNDAGAIRCMGVLTQTIFFNWSIDETTGDMTVTQPGRGTSVYAIPVLSPDHFVQRYNSVRYGDTTIYDFEYVRK